VTSWERRAEWPLTFAALLFLVAYAVPILWPGVPSATTTACSVVVWATWVLFVVDYVVRLVAAQSRGRFVVRHLLDLAAVALPLLRPLRLLRLVLLLRVVNREASESLRGRVVVYVAGGASFLAFLGALSVLDAERGASGSNIEDFPTALWWAVTTMTTVGYGDHFPVTEQGRLAAVLLMIGGVALLGVVTATLASWLVRAVAQEEDDSTESLRVEIDGLRSEVRALTDALGRHDAQQQTLPDSLG
jgi:voltage-gated potassium channel